MKEILFPCIKCTCCKGLPEADLQPLLCVEDQHGQDEAGLSTARALQSDRTGWDYYYFDVRKHDKNQIQNLVLV